MVDMQKPRLSVGIISGGAVGTAVAERLAAAGHMIHGIVARSDRSQRRVQERLPGTRILSLEEAAQAALVIIAVPDTQLAEVIRQVAGITRDGQIVAHTSGAHGCEILQPITDTGAVPLALHPVMTFSGLAADNENLQGCAWGVTADSETGEVIAELLVSSMEGVPVRVPEENRPAYHAAIAHAANHVVTLLSSAQQMLDAALAEPGQAIALPTPESATLLRGIVPVAVDRALSQRMSGLTGPVARDDAQAVRRHIDALEELQSASPVANYTGAYISMAERTAQMLHAIEVERMLGELDQRLR